MSGHHRNLTDTQFTQQNIGKFVNINKSTKDKEGNKGNTKLGRNSTDLNNPSTARQLGQPQSIVTNRRL